MQTRRRGFTLIELLIVVVIIGILAAIAIPKFGQSKEKAYVAAMKSDLRNLTTAQESYYIDNNSSYATTTAALGSTYRTSTGVSVIIGSVTGSGWAATASHTTTAKVCTIALGAAATGGSEPVCN